MIPLGIGLLAHFKRKHSLMLPKSTKAAILFQTNGTLEICNIDLPELMEGQVLVKIKYSSICRSQIMEIFGHRGEDRWLPHLLGHEGVGEVLATGKNVTKVNIGDKVIMGWICGDGIDAAPATYHYNGHKINSGKVTTFSHHSIVSENRLVKLPHSLPEKIAPLFGCAFQTGAGIVFNELKPAPQDTVAVIGLGGIGLSALLALKACGIKTLIAVDIDDKRLKIATEMGATHTLNSTQVDLLSWISQHLPNGLDACIEAAGQIKTIELGFNAIKPKGGRLIFASHPPEGEKISLHPHDLISGKSIAGSWGGSCHPDQDIPRLSNAYADKNLPLDQLIGKTYTLDNINQAVLDFKNGKTLRPLITMDHV